MLNYDERNRLLLAKRQILLQQRVDVSAQERISSAVLELNALDAASPITLYIDSSGGDGGSGYMLMDAILNSAAPIHGLVIGVAFSMAFGILQTCRRRAAYENATLMFHGSKMNDFRVDREDLDELVANIRARDQKQLAFYARRTGQSLDQLKEWSKAEKQFMAPEAKNLGFLDEIIIPVK